MLLGDNLPFLTLLGLVLTRSTSPMTLSIWAIATVTVALAGPFGTFTAVPTAVSLAFWTLAIGLSILVANLVVVTVATVLPDWSRGRLDLIVPAVFSLIYTPMLCLVGLLFCGPDSAEMLSFLQCLLIVLIVAYSVMLLQRIYRNGWMRAEMARPEGMNIAAAPATAPAISRARLLDRIDGAPDSPVLRVTVDNHYAIVHLQDGSRHRLLMRFGDAIAELDGINGYHTHRSHWVAEGAVVRVLRAGGREIALLVDGAVVPVGRTYRDNLVQRGFVPGKMLSAEAAAAE